MDKSSAALLSAIQSLQTALEETNEKVDKLNLALGENGGTASAAAPAKKKRAPTKKWEDEDKQTLVNDFKKGKSLEEMNEAFPDRTPGAILGQLAKVLRTNESFAGKDDAKIIKKYPNIDPKTLEAIRASRFYTMFKKEAENDA